MKYRRNYKIVIVSILALCMLAIQESGLCQENQKPKPGTQEKSQPLTAEQTQQITKILSGYKAATLTADQAKAIHEKFREAGIRAGAETSAAITAAGFDPEKLRQLAPPPGMGDPGKSGPPSLEERLKQVDEKICTPLSLTAVQKETVSKAFSDFYTEMDNLAKSRGDGQRPPDRSKVEPLEKARNEKIKKALSGEQFKKYLELEKASRPKKPDEQ